MTRREPSLPIEKEAEWAPGQVIFPVLESVHTGYVAQKASYLRVNVGASLGDKVDQK
jgi:hypothetical protein